MSVSATAVKLIEPRKLRDELKLVRKRNGLSCETLAEIMGYHTNSVHRWERLGRLPGLKAASDWAAALGFDLKVTLVPTDE